MPIRLTDRKRGPAKTKGDIEDSDHEVYMHMSQQKSVHRTQVTIEVQALTVLISY